MDRKIVFVEQDLEQCRQNGHYQMCYWKSMYEEEDGEERDHAFHKMKEVEEYLRRIYRHQKLLTDGKQAYRLHKNRLEKVISEGTVEAGNFLKEKLNHLRVYSMIQYSGSHNPGLSTAQTSATETTKSFEPLDYPLPEGFRWVLLTEIDKTEIPENLSFEKVSSSEMKKGFECLQKQILPALKEDKTRDSHYFEDRDREKGKKYSEGEQRIFDAFFRGGHIRLERWEGDPHYSITNGRHRIAVAYELGWAMLPAETVDVRRGGGRNG